MLKAGKISDVVYFYDLDETRVKEAEATARVFGFNAEFAGLGYSFKSSNDILREDTIFVPTIKDEHPQHKSINLLGRSLARSFGCRLGFYSVDMNVPYRVTLKDRAEKKRVLESLYPSQSVLLQNEKYHLFEAITWNELVKEIYVENQLLDTAVSVKSYYPPKINASDLEKFNSIDDVILKYWDRFCVEVTFTRGDVTEYYSG